MIILILIVILCLSYFFSTLSIVYARRAALTDQANERSSHQGMALRGGGIVFILAFYLGMGGLYLSGSIAADTYQVLLLCGSFAIGALGWFDDRVSLSPRFRLLVQLVATSLVVAFLPKLWFWCPVLLEKLILTLAWVWFINLFNFMDGADGFAAQQGIFNGLSSYLLVGLTAVPLLILSSALMGFLRVNRPKAKIFMGDIGSLFLGYLIGGYLLLFLAQHKISLIEALLLTSLFSFDATYTLLKRIYQKKPVLQAHREHWYQRYLICVNSHKKLFFLACIYNVCVLLCLYLSHYYMPYWGGYLAVAVLAVYTLFIKFKEQAMPSQSVDA